MTTTFDDKELGGLPQVPFSSFRLDFDGGPTAVLTSPAHLRAEHRDERDDAVVGQRTGHPL